MDTGQFDQYSVYTLWDLDTDKDVANILPSMSLFFEVFQFGFRLKKGYKSSGKRARKSFVCLACYQAS